MRKLKIAVVGCGRIAKVYLDVFMKAQDIIEVVAAVDKERERAEEFSAHFSNCSAHENIDEILEKEIDVVHILTPHFLHKEHAVKCLDKNFNVLLEKPIATTIEDAREILKAAKKSSGKLEIIFQNRLITGVEKLKELIKSGKCGAAKGVSSSLTWWRPPSYYECDWKGSIEKEGGGVVIDQAIHSLDMVRYLLDDEVEFLVGNTDRRILTNIEVEDVAEAYLKFKKGTVYTFYACNYFFENVPIKIDFYFENGRASLVGETMTIECDDQKIIYENDSDLEVDANVSYWGKNHEKQISNFYQTVIDDKEVFVSGEDAVKTLELVLGIYKSSELKERVNLPLQC